jgi:hypothetical protein
MTAPTKIAPIVEPPKTQPVITEVVANFDNMWGIYKIIWIIVPIWQVTWHSIIWVDSNDSNIVDPISAD